MKTTINRYLFRGALAACIALQLPAASRGQRAHVREEIRELKTYPFSAPNPIPMVVKDSRLYPYHRFEGYSHEAAPQPWKVVKLENDFIRVFVLPEVGGKVWGAIEKSTGNEFIYRNEVMKFRNISLRGPWTSGGIEFNFGVIGHTPATATPVDYLIRENADGSATCIVGAMDLPSRTHWRVQIHLPKDKAFFETNAIWYNGTPISQPNYNWMTAAAFAQDDLEMFIPGSKYLKHSGEVKPWPIDGQGRLLSTYSNNTFEGHKSYHVIGEYNDFFGGYFKKEGYGFGHWAPYSDMPGKKLWLWALSRQGGIWEDLLTDTDGQYVEFQAGRYFVQYAAGAHENPIREGRFEPQATEQWHEIWFPVKDIGGMSEVSEQGVLHVRRSADRLFVSVNAFAAVDGALAVTVDGTAQTRQPFSLQPMGIYRADFAADSSAALDVQIAEMDLHYRSESSSRKLLRPFKSEPGFVTQRPEADQLLMQGVEQANARRYGKAQAIFKKIVAKYPAHTGALKALAEIQFRHGEYRAGLANIHSALKVDTYDAEANYLGGLLYRALGDLVNAKESQGWAARALAFRSAANAELAEIALLEEAYGSAQFYGRRALEFNHYNMNARQALAVAARMVGDKKSALAAISQLLEIDPINHLAWFEKYLLLGDEASRAAFAGLIRNEYPEQSYLELAIFYANRGLPADAQSVLSLFAREHKKVIPTLWQAWLGQMTQAPTAALLADAEQLSPAFVFPFRRETLPALRWAVTRSDHWVWKYYLALNLWAKERKTEAASLLEACLNQPDFAPFFVARASLRAEKDGASAEADLLRAVELDGQNWLIRQPLITFYQSGGQWEKALAQSQVAYRKFPDNFDNAAMHARSLLFNDKALDATKVLDQIQVLPSEASRTSRQLYEWAHIQTALAKMAEKSWSQAIEHAQKSMLWPENLGSGRPYDSEERLQNFLLYHCNRAAGNRAAARKNVAAIVQQSAQHPNGSPLQRYLTSLVLRVEGRTQEAKDMLASIVEPGEASPLTQWVRAHAGGDQAGIRQLLAKHPAVFEGFFFRLIEKALRITENLK